MVSIMLIVITGTKVPNRNSLGFTLRALETSTRLKTGSRESFCNKQSCRISSSTKDLSQNRLNLNSYCDPNLQLISKESTRILCNLWIESSKPFLLKNKFSHYERHRSKVDLLRYGTVTNGYNVEKK